MICFYKQLDYTQMKFLGNQDALNWCLDDFNAFFFFFSPLTLCKSSLLVYLRIKGFTLLSDV